VHRSTISAALLCAALVVAAACGGGDHTTGATSDVIPPSVPACGPTTAVFAIPPVALSDFVGWEPLGAFNPPGHTFPTDHQYIYVNNPASQAPRREVNIVAPADLTITHARKGTSNPGSITDYTLDFAPCAEVYGEFGHVLTVAPSILNTLEPFDQFCSTYSPAPGATVSVCESKSVAIKIAAGDVIGTAGGPSPHSFGLDFSLWDARVAPTAFANPARWPTVTSKFDRFHVVPGSDYFAEPARSQIAPRMGSFDGTIRRTAPPVGGTLDVDVPGTAMGVWFTPSQPTFPEYMHLAIAPDHVNPSRIDISPGISLTNWNRGLVFFTPTSSGFVNRHPAQITADGQIYCLETLGSWAVIVQLTNASTLRIEGLLQPATCASAKPWAFTSAAVQYVR